MEDAADGVRQRESRPPMPAKVRRIAGVAVALFWVVLLALLFLARLSLLDSLMLAMLLVAVPGLSVAQLPLIGDVPLERLPAYWSSITTLWLLGMGSWFVGTREGGAEAIGLTTLPWGAALAWSVGLTLAGLATIFAFRLIGLALRARESPMLRQLLPVTHEERLAFGALSVAAGCGEEIAYRGYALSVLVPLAGVPGAVLVTSVVFGVLHGYQGLLGILRTATMGAMLAWGFLMSGSLVPAMVAHTAIDLVAGLWLGDRLLSPEPGPGVGRGPDPTPSTH
jgi:membrane protease YdiL (CAAX protease family)